MPVPVEARAPRRRFPGAPTRLKRALVLALAPGVAVFGEFRPISARCPLHGELSYPCFGMQLCNIGCSFDNWAEKSYDVLLGLSKKWYSLDAASKGELGMGGTQKSCFQRIFSSLQIISFFF